MFSEHAETAGFDGLWAIDHLAIPWTMESTYMLARQPAVVRTQALQETMGLNLEIATTLAVAAVTTSSIRLGTSVMVLPLRSPPLNARQLASIDLYSGGRLVCGFGVGWLREEADAMGMPWAARGRRSEEHIAAVCAIWRAEDIRVSFDGECFAFPQSIRTRRPGQAIPILIGGHSEVALERAARIGDGWIGAMGTDRLPEAIATLRAACTAQRRNFDELSLVTSCRVQLTTGATPTEVVDELLRYNDIGIHRVQGTVR